MTKEEAIKVLTNLLDNLEDDPLYRDNFDALLLAINALEHQADKTNIGIVYD